MLYLTCTMLSRVDLAHYEVLRAKIWIHVDCGTIFFHRDNLRHEQVILKIS